LPRSSNSFGGCKIDLRSSKEHIDKLSKTGETMAEEIGKYCEISALTRVGMMTRLYIVVKLPWNQKFISILENQMLIKAVVKYNKRFK